MSGSLVIEQTGLAPSGRELRVSERVPCDVPASCQPPSDWKRGGQKWTARVRDLSTHGLCLVLGRRFERGAGLAIELPGADPDSPSTLLARVMNVSSESAGQWVLGCAFVSPLSDEELQTLTQTPAEEPARTGPLEADDRSVVDVYFRGKLVGGGIVERRIRKFNCEGQWPLAPGRRIGLRLHDSSGGFVAKVLVDACRSANGRWVLDCTFIEPPPAGVLAAPRD